MRSWMEFAAAQPAMAALGQRILSKYGIAYLATVRPDGGPRVHPVCPVIIEDHLCIGIIPTSPKRRDLDRDGRYLLHALPGPNDAEFAVAGLARRLRAGELDDIAQKAGPNVRLSPQSVMYELGIERVSATTYERGPDSVPLPTHFRWQDERNGR